MQDPKSYQSAIIPTEQLSQLQEQKAQENIQSIQNGLEYLEGKRDYLALEKIAKAFERQEIEALLSGSDVFKPSPPRPSKKRGVTGEELENTRGKAKKGLILSPPTATTTTTIPSELTAQIQNLEETIQTKQKYLSTLESNIKRAESNLEELNREIEKLRRFQLYY